LLTKHKEENFANIARGWNLLAPAGTLVCAGANDDGAASLERQVGKVFAEDMEILELQQRNLLAHPERKLLMLNIDTGGVQSRRVLDRILAAEQAAVQPMLSD